MCSTYYWNCVNFNNQQQLFFILYNNLFPFKDSIGYHIKLFNFILSLSAIICYSSWDNVFSSKLLLLLTVILHCFVILISFLADSFRTLNLNWFYIHVCNLVVLNVYMLWYKKYWRLLRHMTNLVRRKSACYHKNIISLYFLFEFIVFGFAKSYFQMSK